MQYRQQQLDNGLTILAECNDQAHFAAYGFFVRTGARDEHPQINGVSHFLEHMVFKGSAQRSAEQVNILLDEMGSSSNARTSEEATIYHAAVLPEFQSPLIDVLADLLQPALRESDFETEKKVIIEEIMMYQDQPPYGGHERLLAEYFGNHPLGLSVLGTVESVSELTADQMRSYFQKQYSPRNIALVGAGKIDFDLLVSDAERLCGSWSQPLPERSFPAVQPQTGFATLHKPTSSLQYLMQIAPGPGIEDDDRYAMRLYSAILGDDGGSRLYWELVDSGRAESAGIGSFEYLGTGLVMSYYCCAPEQAQENLQRLADLQELGQSGVTEKELHLAKQKIVSQILLASERTESRMFSVGGQWLNHQTYKTPAEIAACYDRVTLDQVNSVAHRYPLNRGFTLSIGPQLDIRPTA